MGMPTSLRLFRDAVDARAGEPGGWGVNGDRNQPNIVSMN